MQGTESRKRRISGYFASSKAQVPQVQGRERSRKGLFVSMWNKTSLWEWTPVSLDEPELLERKEKQEAYLYCLWARLSARVRMFRTQENSTSTRGHPWAARGEAVHTLGR